MSAKLVVLGISGFVGARLFEHWRGMKEISVKGYSSSTLDLTAPGCVGDLCEVLDEETALIVTARAREATNPFETFSNDIAIVTNVARCLSQQRVKKCVYFSTLSVYGEAETNLSISEETPIAPASPYGVAKFAGECLLRQVAQKAGIPLVVFRSCKIFGPGDHPQSYGPTQFINSILREKKVYMIGDGRELRDHVFIDDVIQITTQFVFGDQQATYNLATGRSCSFQEIVGRLRELVPKEFDVIQVDRSRPKVDQRINPAKLLKSLPGFRFSELEQSLTETFRYFATRF